MDIKLAAALSTALLLAGCIDRAMLPESSFLLGDDEPVAAASADRCGNAVGAVQSDVGWPSTTLIEGTSGGVLHAQLSGRDGSVRIVRVDPLTGQLTDVLSVPGMMLGGYAVSPDGALAAFTVDPMMATIERGGEPDVAGLDSSESPTELHVARTDGSGSADVVHGSRMPISALGWSPDSGQLVFTTDRAVWRFDVADGTTTSISTVGGARRSAFHTAAWSPDGSWILHSAFNYDRFARVRPDGTDRSPVALGHDFSWSPSANAVAIADASGIRLADPSFTSAHYVVVGPGSPVVWSPRGDSIAFYADEGYSVAPLCVIESSGALREIASCAYPTSIAWSPDATRIALTEMVSPGECELTTHKRLAIVDLVTGHSARLGRDLYFPTWRD